MRLAYTLRCLVCVFCVLHLMPQGGAIHAQTTGGIVGVVTDESGLSVPGAKVTALHAATNIAHTETTQADGSFRMVQVPIGSYDLTVEFEGFQTLHRTGVVVITGRTTDLRLQLSVGAVTQQVEVVGLTPTVQSQSAEVQETIDSRAMRELPLNGRNALQLMVLTPGARFSQSAQFNTPENGGWMQNPGVAVNGLQTNDNNYRVDGANYNNALVNAAPALPNPDSLEEFTVKASNYSAEFARAGATVQFSTRSGSNNFHGSVFEFFRNEKLDARPFFSASREHFVRNQVGGTIGGPIKKDKTFFFGSVQFTRKRGDPNVRTMTVPTAAERNGDFSGQKPIFDQAAGVPFPANQIPSGRFDPITKALIDMYPLPVGSSRNVTRPYNVSQNEDQYLARVDHYFTSTHQIDARFFYSNEDSVRDTNSLASIIGRPLFDNYLVSVNDTYTASANFLLTTSFSYTLTKNRLSPESPFTLHELGATYPLGTEETPREIRQFPTGYTRFFSGGLLQMEPQIYEAKGHVSWLLKSHTLQFGADIERYVMNSFDFSAGSGQFWYNGNRTTSPDIKQSGLPMADFILGRPNRFMQRGGSYQRFRESKFHFWVNDSWKIHSRLTLNLGLRYEPWLPFTDLNAPFTGLAPGVQSTELPNAPTGLIFAGAGISDLPNRGKIFANDLNNLAPRFGFAWDVLGDSTTIIRGGYGVFYRSPPFNVLRDNLQKMPYSGLQVDVFDPPGVADPWTDTPGGSPFPFEATPVSELKQFEFMRPVSTAAMDLTARSSYVQSWNFTIERELVRGSSLSVGYVGSHGLKQLVHGEGNPGIYGPGATTGNINSRRVLEGIASVGLVTTAFGDSRYDSLQVRLTRRSPTGLNVIASYVFGKAIDIASYSSIGTGNGPRDPFNYLLDRGPVNGDIAHDLTVSLNYPIPRLTTKRGFVGAVVNNWQLNSIISARSGSAFSVTAGRDRSLTGVNRDHADLIGDPKLENWTINEYFNRDAFALPALGTVGTAGRNFLRGPARWGVDLSVFKDIPITEALRAQLRGEAFNAFNRTQFGGPVSNLNSGNFGRILSTGDPRVIQLALKLMF